MPATLGENPRKRLLATRRGVTVLIVLLLLSITLGLSYAIVRSQTTALQVQQNANVRVSARQAAMNGMSVALGTIHRNTWAGVGSTLSGDLSAYERYEVAFQPGDSSLDPTDPYYPYRVTILSTGFSRDPGDSRRIAEHRVGAVLELVPRGVATRPTGWDDVCQSTMLQYSRSGAFHADVPFRIIGRVEVQSADFHLTSYAWPDAACARFFSDLEAMRNAGTTPDWRPFMGEPDGPVYLYDIPDDETSENLVRYLGIDFGSTSSDYSSFVGNAASTYRIYENGPQYSVESLNSATLRNWSFQPSVPTNPLRLIKRSGSVEIGDNVTIQGTLIVSSDLTIAGSGVQLAPVDLPRLEGQVKSLRLPTAIVHDDLEIRDAAGELVGLFNVADRFEIASGSQGALAGLAMRLQAVARKVVIGKRHEWLPGPIPLLNRGEWWEQQWSAFNTQKNDPQGTPYFPEYLRLKSPLLPRLQPEPKIVIGSGSDDTITYHWEAPPGATTSLHDGIYRFKDDTAVPDGKGHFWAVKQWKDEL